MDGPFASQARLASPGELAGTAAKVLRAGTPRLCPRTWDTAFAAIGLAHLDPPRALAELDTLVAEHRAGSCQPPVHAVVLRRVLDIASSADRDGSVADGARRLWPELFAWHRWLACHRMPDPSGLIAVAHRRESGMDDSPRWDAPHPDGFPAGDVFSTAVFGLACQVLAELGAELGCGGQKKLDDLNRWARGARAAVATTCHPDNGMARDLRGGTWLEADSVAGFAPLLCGGAPMSVELRLLAEFGGPRWAGHPALAAGVPPSVSPLAPSFDPRRCWRGPQWPVLAWLFGWAFERRGWARRAGRIRAEGLALTSDGRFGGCYEPFTGEPIGSHDQPWTAAVVLDWVGDLRFT